MDPTFLEQEMAEQVAQLQAFAPDLQNAEPLFYYFHVAHSKGLQILPADRGYLSGRAGKVRLDLRLPQQPFVCARENVRDAMRRLRADQIPHVDLPVRDDFDSGTTSYFEHRGDVLMGSDAVLHLKIDGEEKLLQILRDETAPVNPLLWHHPGGVVTENPSRTALKELNEEVSILVDDGRSYQLLRLSSVGYAGLSRDQKALQIPKARELASKKYPGTFKRDQDITVLDVPLKKRLYASWQEATILTRVGNRVIDRFRSYVTIAPKRSALAVHQSLELSAGFYQRKAFKTLLQGVNCFFVDNEYGRDVAAFSYPEIAAIRDAGAYVDNVGTFFQAAKALEQIRPCAPHAYPFVNNRL